MNKRISGLILVVIITFIFLIGTTYANNISITNEITSPENRTIWTYNSEILPNEAAIAINLTNEAKSREPVTVILAIDCSGSMIDSDPNRFRVEAANEFVNLIAQDNVKHKIGVVLWNDIILGVLEPTDDLDAVKKYLDNADASGFTCFSEALNAADSSLNNASTKGKVLILLSDGINECYAGSDFVAKARDMRSRGISIYTIGLGFSKIEDLQEIGEYYHVSRPDAMLHIFRDFATKVKISLTHVKLEYHLPKNLEPFDIYPAAVYSSTEKENILTWYIRDMYFKQNMTMNFKIRSKNPGNYTLPLPMYSKITYFVDGIEFHNDEVPQTNLLAKFHQPGNEGEEENAYLQISKPLKSEEANKLFG